MADLILVVAETQDGKPKKITYELIAAARQVAEAVEYEVGVAVLGEGLDNDELAQDLGARGVNTLYVADDSALAEYAVEPSAAALQHVIEEAEPELVLLGMTVIGRELAPRVAAKLRTGMASDITGLAVEDGEVIITRPMYAGQVNAKVKLKGSPVLVTVRPNTWAAAPASGGDAAAVEEVAMDDLPESRSEILSVEAKGGDRPALGDASIVVSGGRGLQTAENFRLIEELADLLGAAVGTTRAVVDAGWRPYDEQVGQTGKTVSPKLYFAVGVSGALQHLSGMRTSKYIVAINKDPDAPIFKLADYGIVADLFEIMPVLTEEARKLNR